MKNPKRIFRNYVLPSMILLPLIGIMVGCIYIPTWDHTLLVGTKKDFRGWAGQHQNAPLAKLAIITRSNVESMFGKPVFVSQNGRCVAYVMGTENDIVIWPLCFGAGFINGRTHIVKLVFDEQPPGAGDSGREVSDAANVLERYQFDVWSRAGARCAERKLPGG